MEFVTPRLSHPQQVLPRPLEREAEEFSAGILGLLTRAESNLFFEQAVYLVLYASNAGGV